MNDAQAREAARQFFYRWNGMYEIIQKQANRTIE